MEFAKMKPLSKNQLEDLTSGLVNAMRYSNHEYEYPNFEGAKSDDGVPAEWFYPIFNGTNSFSELTAIHMYVTQEATFEEIGELMLGIGLTEMKHFDKLSDFIKKLGGRVDQKFNNSGVSIGNNAVEALSIAIKSERETIVFYEKIQQKLKDLSVTKTIEIAFQLTSKLIADEEVHLSMLLERLKILADEETYDRIAAKEY